MLPPKLFIDKIVVYVYNRIKYLGNISVSERWCFYFGVGICVGVAGE